MAVENGNIGMSSYESALLRLGFKRPEEMDPNTILVLNSDTYATLRQHKVLK